VRTRIFVQHIADWEAVARAHGAIFGEIRPANTLVRAEMIDPQMLVEIEMVAVVGAD
jgi:enamine deaminase RidA (YjgF/YER057c/UK114 family)